MVVIRKLAITLLALMFLAILAILVGISVNQNQLQRPINGSSATNDAVSIAMNDHDVQSELSLNNVKPIVESKPFIPGATKGFLNFSDNMTVVHIALRSPQVPPPDYNYYFIVDTDRDMIVDKTSFFDVMAGPDEMALPAGSAWYYDISRSAFQFENGSAFVSFWARYFPEYASVYLVMVDKAGLEKLRNAPAAAPLNDVDISNDTLVFNSIIPPSPGWSGTVDLPPARDSYYMVFINGEKDRTVNVSLSLGLAGAVYY